MAYALIPDGYSLKKVTKAQEQAVNTKRRHDDTLALLNNPATISTVGTFAFAFLAGKLLQGFWDDLAALGVNISDEVKEELTKKRTFGTGAPVGISLEQLLEAAPSEISKQLGKIPFL